MMRLLGLLLFLFGPKPPKPPKRRWCDCGHMESHHEGACQHGCGCRRFTPHSTWDF